ncbi:STAS domain-containing protein [Aromatoleum toluclasticum]|uniref:STAS domain-containing protein n=1 Tax=Aromatoleum toluclasticum TaxID=92003 RepID=UPI00036566D2|nr:STAS domain-containing protein [Aromatoleum toluclasticum]
MESSISDAGELCALIGDVLERQPRAVNVDASGLVRVDTAVLQAFVVLARELGRRGVPLRWQGCSGELAQAADLLALSALLGIAA